MWQDFLAEYNGKSFSLLDKVHTDQALQLYTDSAKSIGYGAVLGCSRKSGRALSHNGTKSQKPQF